MNVLLVRAKPDFTDMIYGLPVGLAFVAAHARQAGHRVAVADLALSRSTTEADERLISRLRETKPDVVGFTAMTVEYRSAARAARLVREHLPSATVVFGGQHPTVRAAETAAEPFCDGVVRGEGEEVFSALLGGLESGADLSKLRGLAFRRDGEVVLTEPHPLVEDLDTLPWPAYDLLEMERYFRANSARTSPKHRRVVQLFTSRGCPWHCCYCHDLFGKRFRGRSPENVVAEMKMLQETWRIREFMIDDDVFNFDIRRAKRIFELIPAEGVKATFQFNNGLRLEHFDEDLVRRMAAAGTHFIAVAIESASPRIQKMIRKHVHLDRAARTLSWMRKYGIRTLGFFMLGFPTETREEIEETIRCAAALDLDEALFSIATPYPGTELSRQVDAMGLYDPDRVSLGGEGFSALKTDQFDFATLKDFQRRAYRTFFLAKGRWLRMLPRLLNVRTSWKYLKAIERNFLPARRGRGTRIS